MSTKQAKPTVSGPLTLEITTNLFPRRERWIWVIRQADGLKVTGGFGNDYALLLKRGRSTMESLLRTRGVGATPER